MEGSAAVSGDVRYLAEQGQSAHSVIVPSLPVNLSDTKEIRKYFFDHFKGREVEIKSDGRLVLFTRQGLEDTLKRRGEHRKSFSALDSIIEESYPVGYEIVDDRHKEKRKDLKGQFVYAALLDINGEHYIAAIKLDDTAADNRAYFKDISIKKRSLYVGQTQDFSLEVVDPSADRNLTVQQLIDFVKRDFSNSPFFSETIPGTTKKNGVLRNFTDGVRFSVAPVIDVAFDSAATEGFDLEEKRKKALRDTLNAKDYWDNEFTESFSIEEWESFSEEERQQIINQEYNEQQEEFDIEAKSKGKIEKGHIVFEALNNALDVSSDFAEDLGFEVLKKDFNSAATSGYLKLWNEEAEESYVIRFSDHEQPEGGSYYTNKNGDSGRQKANISVVITNDKMDLAPVWDFLQKKAKKNGDNEVRYSIEEYSESDQRDIVAILQPFVGQVVDLKESEYRKYLLDHGVDIPEEDAKAFAIEAMRANQKLARQRGIRKRDNWLYENYPLFAMVAEVAGDNFIINPEYTSSEGEHFTGSWISPECVKYSGPAKFFFPVTMKIL